MKARHLCSVLAAALWVWTANAQAADLSILNTNAPGFSDTTPATPVSINFGTTRGQQALIVFQTAAAMWGATVQSTVPIIIDSEFDSSASQPRFTCSASSIVLAFTVPGGFVTSSSFANPNAGYTYSLANALSGTDLAYGGAQFQVNINADLGTSSCPFPAAWYFGLDTNIPENGLSLFTTLLHEFGHGLGFYSLVDPSNGQDDANYFSIFDYHIFDTDAGVSWTEESSAQRQRLASTPSSIAFGGPAVQADIPTFLAQPPTLLTTFNSVTTSLNFAKGDFSAPLVGPSRPLVAANPLDACSDLTNASGIFGNYALIERSFADAGVVCTFLSKTERALDAGAVGVIIFDYKSEELIEMAGTPVLSIPATFISNQDGTTLLTEVGQGLVTAAFGTSSHISNTDPTETQVLLYTPSTVSAGSSVSHWNADSYPHTLNLEYAIQPDIRLNMDFTPDVMSDLGWTVVKGLGVSVVKLLDPEVTPGGQASYVTAVINRRTTTIDSVSLDLTLPTGATFISNASSPSVCATAFPCTLGPMQPGDVILVVTTIQVPTTTSSPFTVTATLTPSSASAGDNLTSTASQTVATGGDLQVSISGPRPVPTGAPAVLTTSITNAGPGEAAGVTLTGTLSGSAADPPTFVGNAGACQTAFPCTLNAIPAGQTVTVLSTYSVPAGFQSGSTFTATVSSTTPDPNLSNNTASFAFSTSGGGCSTTGEPVSVLGLLGVALAVLVRRRRDTF